MNKTKQPKSNNFEKIKYTKDSLISHSNFYKKDNPIKSVTYTTYNNKLPDINKNKKMTVSKLSTNYLTTESSNLDSKLKYKLNNKSPENLNFKRNENNINCIYPFKNGQSYVTISTLPEKNPKKISNEIKKYDYIYSPRTTFLNERKEEEKLFRDLEVSLDPILLKIMRFRFKECLGELDMYEFIFFLKNNLYQWHPDLPNREEILTKLLYKLFHEIDVNGKKKITWDQFTKYLVLMPNNNISETGNYDLRVYTHINQNIESNDFSDVISYAFYIEKYNLIGIVYEGKSFILFYDADSLKKEKTIIDLKETQNNIDQVEYKLYDLKAKEKIQKEEEDKKKKLIAHLEQQKQRNNSLENKNGSSELLNSGSENGGNKKVRKINTPEKLKKEIYKINNPKKSNTNQKNINKKLVALTTCFIDEYDTLIVSSSNNKISAWQYINDVFVNINKLDENSKFREKDRFTISILRADLPQITLDWEPVRKQLYSGQEDGKILIWDLNKNKHIDILDFRDAKRDHDNDIKNNRLFNYNTITVKDEGNEKYKVEYTGWTKNTDNSSFNFNNSVNINLSNTKNQKLIEEKQNDKQGQLFESNLKFITTIKKSMTLDSVSCIKVLGKMQLLAAGYYNGCIILWDTMLRNYRKFYCDQNTGIYGIEYCQSKNLIFSCGFDHDIYVYDPFIDGCCKRRLIGHYWSINSLSVNSNNELISIDIYGNIKIWDLNNFYNFQTININEETTLINTQKNKEEQSNKKKIISSNQKMIFLNKNNKIFTYGGNKNMLFAQDNYNFPELCDSQSVLGCFCNKERFLFYTICLKKIKLWNMFNGKLKKIYDNFFTNNSAEITAFCTDKQINRVFIGDSFGYTYSISLTNGKVLETYIKHDTEIIQVFLCSNHDLFISISNDRIIKIQGNNEYGINSLIKEINMESSIITSINYCETFSRFIIGTLQGELKFFDMEHLKPDFQDSEINKDYWGDAVTTIAVFEGYPICLSFHDSCRAKFEIIPPNNMKYYFFGKFQNMLKKKNCDKEIKSRITAYSFNNKKKQLFTGDFYGYVNIYLLNDLLKIFDETKTITKEMITSLKNYKINLIFTFEAHKEQIKNIIYVDASPEILVTTSNDRRVKLFKPDNGNYIDELKQLSQKEKEAPIGIRYYIADPFVSKVSPNSEKVTGIVYRDDISFYKDKQKKNQNLLYRMRRDRKNVFEYGKEVTEINAQEKLYFLTRNIKLEKNKSTNWGYLPDINEIIHNEEQNYLNIKNYFEVNKLKFLTIYNCQYINHKEYQPEFIEEMGESNKKEFEEILNRKRANIKLTMSKFNEGKRTFYSYKKEPKQNTNFNYKDDNKFITNLRSLDKKTNRLDSVILRKNIDKRNGGNRYEWFDNYKADFDRNMLELKNTMHKKFHKKLILNNNSNHDINNKNNEKKNSNDESIDESSSVIDRNKKSLPNISTNHNSQFLNFVRNNRTNYNSNMATSFNKSASKSQNK